MRRLLLAGIILVSFTLTGCAGGAQRGANLAAGFRALEQRNYSEALARAEEHLKQAPRGPASAEALYLRGRVYEQRPAQTPQQAQQDMDMARSSYARALASAPPALLGHLHAGLANIAYWSEDYATSARHWQIAHQHLENRDAKAWALYRLGLCQQRMGQFVEADRTYTLVQQQFAGTVQAQRAQERQGSRAFAVQVGVFATPAAADNAIATLQREGAPVQRTLDAQGRQVIRVGPLASYEQALAMRERFAVSFPGAFIVP